MRLVAWRLKPACGGEAAALVAFGVAAVAGLGAAATTSWWLLAVGAAAIAAAGSTPAAPSPYGYVGLGEVFVFVFFGLVATIGTTYVAVERITGLSVVMGSAAGAWPAPCSSSTTCATSRRTPRRASGRWLSDSATADRWLYVALVAAAFALVLVAAAVAGSWVPRRGGAASLVGGPGAGAARRTGRLQLAYGALVVLGRSSVPDQDSG